MRETFPLKAKVACQGIEGAYSQLACCRLFKESDRIYCKTFEDVFAAIENESCEYGVLPIENSTAGSVNKVYDLLMRYECYIVRSIKLKIEHNLLVKPGTSLDEITEIISHEQALNQCENYIKSKGIQCTTVCENTAVAARYVASSDVQGLAAISSAECVKIYGLETVDRCIQDVNSNYTRFICISKKFREYDDTDTTSLMLVLPHITGALYHVLECMYRYDINLVKLESRPVRNDDNEYMFYFDIEAGLDKEEMKQMLGDIEDMCGRFRYLGSYKRE